jgi:hypothetical protein
MTPHFPRRSVLRGLFAGSAVTVGMPLFDCFLNENGTALASGAPIPVRFGTWFWGLGHTPGRAIATDDGTGYRFLEECTPLTPYKAKINFFTKFGLPIEGKPNVPHVTGDVALRTGALPSGYGDFPLPTFDVLIADVIGTGTRFRSIELAATGNPRDSLSARGTGNVNPPEISPVAFYTRIFGPDFADPNSAVFKPDPRLLLRRSVLSAIDDQAKDFSRVVGRADRARMDEYFTSIRQLEQQIALQLEKPARAEACAVPSRPPDGPVGTDVETAVANQRIMSELLAMTLACNQTRVFNMLYSWSQSLLRKSGDTATHHTLSHEEPIDAALGYQPENAWFNLRSMEALADFIAALDKVREGDGTLLDHTLVIAHSDTNYAKIHAVDEIPVMTIGSGGGRIKTGLHIHGGGDPVTRIGLTAQQIMGVSVDRWGVGALSVSKPIDEIRI